MRGSGNDGGVAFLDGGLCSLTALVISSVPVDGTIQDASLVFGRDRFGLGQPDLGILVAGLATHGLTC